MQVNKVQSPSFGECRIHPSANILFDKLPSNKISDLFQKAFRVQDSKHWDMYIKKSKYADDAFVTYFINKKAPLEKSFIGDMFPFDRSGKIVSALAPHPHFSLDNNVYYLEFESEERASEVYRFLNQTKPQKDEGIFDREFKILDILEESYEYMASPKSLKEEKTSFIEKILNFFKK